MLATGAVVSAPPAADGSGWRPPARLSAMVIPVAQASGAWMDAGAGRAARAVHDLAVAPRTVLTLAVEVSDAALTTMVPAVADARAALAEGDAMGARIAVDGLLGVLREDVDSGVVPMTLAVPIADQLCGLRAQATWALGAPPRGSQGAFLTRIAPAAMLGDWQYGVPASVTIAQAVLESNWGRSAPGHNLFGLKGQGPAGSTVRQVVEYRHGRRGTRRDPFRAYHTEAEALADHARILGTRARYARARAAGDDRQAFARALVGVYASDPRYAGKLDRIIGLFDLDRMDYAGQRATTPRVAAAAEVSQLVDLQLPWQLPAAWGVGE